MEKSGSTAGCQKLLRNVSLSAERILPAALHRADHSQGDVSAAAAIVLLPVPEWELPLAPIPSGSLVVQKAGSAQPRASIHILFRWGFVSFFPPVVVTSQRLQADAGPCAETCSTREQEGFCWGRKWEESSGDASNTEGSSADLLSGIAALHSVQQQKEHRSEAGQSSHHCPRAGSCGEWGSSRGPGPHRNPVQTCAPGEIQSKLG